MSSLSIFKDRKEGDYYIGLWEYFIDRYGYHDKWHHVIPINKFLTIISKSSNKLIDDEPYKSFKEYEDYMHDHIYKSSYLDCYEGEKGEEYNLISNIELKETSMYELLELEGDISSKEVKEAIEDIYEDEKLRYNYKDEVMFYNRYKINGESYICFSDRTTDKNFIWGDEIGITKIKVPEVVLKTLDKKNGRNNDIRIQVGRIIKEDILLSLIDENNLINRNILANMSQRVDIAYHINCRGNYTLDHWTEDSWHSKSYTINNIGEVEKTKKYFKRKRLYKLDVDKLKQYI